MGPQGPIRRRHQSTWRRPSGLVQLGEPVLDERRQFLPFEKALRQARQVGRLLGQGVALGFVRFVEEAGGQGVVGVDRDFVAVGHVSKHLESTAAHGLLLLHAAHEFRLGDGQVGPHVGDIAANFTL